MPIRRLRDPNATFPKVRKKKCKQKQVKNFTANQWQVSEINQTEINVITMSGGNKKGSGSGLSPNSTGKPKQSRIIQMYDILLKGENLNESSFGDTYWSEFYLLKPKVNYLESEMIKMTPEQVTNARLNLNTLFEQSLNNLAEEHHIRVVYALQTLCGLLKAAFKKQCTGGIDLVNLLMGFEAAEKRMAELINHINDFLVGDEPASLKDLCLKLLLIIATGKII